MRQERWYERHAWLWFAVVSGVFIPLALIAFVDPVAGLDTWERFGYPLPAGIASDPPAMEYVEFITHWTSTGSIGFDLFGFAIAATAFRHGESWAWLVFWYWPILFLTHFFTYQSDFRYLQLVWLVISVLLLVGTFNKAWRRDGEEAGRRVAGDPGPQPMTSG